MCVYVAPESICNWAMSSCISYGDSPQVGSSHQSLRSPAYRPSSSVRRPHRAVVVPAVKSLVVI